MTHLAKGPGSHAADGVDVAEGGLQGDTAVLAAAQSFYKVYLVPSMGHFPVNGTVNPNASPPIPGKALKYQMLTDWVEKGVEPGRDDISSLATPTAPAKSQPLCVYPQKAGYTGGDVNSSASYACQ